MQFTLSTLCPYTPMLSYTYFYFLFKPMPPMILFLLHPFNIYIYAITSYTHLVTMLLLILQI
ncbi:hypothetical protein CLU79DRAFT_742397 [Phycomyces nitens]|nr:hypothetical protein CLU79DRAFT_742397 [Phycomyces nitens]